MIFPFKINQTEDNDLITNSVTLLLVECYSKQHYYLVQKARAYSSESRVNMFWTQNKKKAHGLWKCNIYIKRDPFTADLLVDPFPFFRF
jgi:hypothetical protein